MNVIGFNFLRMSAKKREGVSPKIPSNIQLDFTSVEKTKLNMLKESEALRVGFSFNVLYEDQKEKKDPILAKVSFEGIIILSTTPEETKDFLKAWKKKQLPKSALIPLYNLILRKCSVKAIQLEEDLNIPPHIPLPQVQTSQKEETEK